jgi:hypothetical protein
MNAVKTAQDYMQLFVKDLTNSEQKAEDIFKKERFHSCLIELHLKQTK